MYVIVTITNPPPSIVHVYGDPSWTTRHRAMTEMKKMRTADREMYPDDEPSSILVRKVITLPPEG